MPCNVPTFAYLAAPLHRHPCLRHVNPRLHLQFRHPISSSSFVILGRGWLLQPPCLFAPSLKNYNKDEWNVWDVQNPTVCDYTTLGHILTIPMQVKQKMFPFLSINFFFANNFWTKKGWENAEHHHIPCIDAHRSTRILTSEDKFENFTSGKIK